MRQLLSTSTFVALLLGFDKIVALARQIIVARVFGLDPALDAYNVANNLPDTLFSLIAGGGLAVAFIPILTETLAQTGRPAFWRLFSHLLNLALVVVAAVAGLLALFALPLVQNVVAPGFSLPQQTLVANLMRLNLVATLIFSVSGICVGALQAHQRFILPALAPGLYNLGQIIGVIFLQPRLGIYGLAWGVILGAALHLSIQIPDLLLSHFRWGPHLTLRDDRVRQVLQLMGPRVLTLACINLIFIANDNLASRLGVVGAVSALTYAWGLLQLPETVIGSAIATVFFPTFSELAAHNKPTEFRSLLRRTIGLLLALTLPVTLLSVLLIGPAVKFVFEGRAFTAAHAELVIHAARFMLLGLAGHALVETCSRVFYAHHDARTPFYLAALTLSVFVTSALALIPGLGFAALALANALAYTAQAVIMLIILYRRKIL